MRRAMLRDVLNVLAVVALLVAVSLLPSDTSLREVERVATLRACVPPSYPPLVTGEAQQPGLDIELLSAVAEQLGVALVLNVNAAIGRDFNPRNWGLNRSQCQVIAGGVVNSVQTRSFLETGPSYADTGWALLAPAPLADLAGKRVGVLTLVSGLDRIGLANYLRAHGVAARVVTTPEALVEGIAAGTFDAGVTEALLASSLAAANGWSASWMPPALARYHVVFGLWKGDITLKRAIAEAFAALEASGKLQGIVARYRRAPIVEPAASPRISGASTS